MPECKVDGDDVIWDGVVVAQLVSGVSWGVLTDFKEAVEDLILLEELDILRSQIDQLEDDLHNARMEALHSDE